MPVSLSVKNVPDDVAALLRERAQENRRSLQGELLAILETAVASPRLTLADVHRRVRQLGLRTPSESTRLIRRMRDGR